MILDLTRASALYLILSHSKQLSNVSIAMQFHDDGGAMVNVRTRPAGIVITRFGGHSGKGFERETYTGLDAFRQRYIAPTSQGAKL